MRAARKTHRPHLQLNIVQREPHLYRVMRHTRPVVTILVPGSRMPPRLLEEHTVVVEADPLDTHKFGRNPPESLRKDKLPDRIALPPEICRLNEQRLRIIKPGHEVLGLGELVNQPGNQRAKMPDELGR